MISIGIWMIRRSQAGSQYRLFGIIALVLGLGDAFHLVPRALALCTTGLASYTAALSIGKLVTSVTMTVFYVILYRVWRLRYRVEGRRVLDTAVCLLAALRIILCLMPQNMWTSADAPLSWGIARNISFALLGLVVIILFFKEAKTAGDHDFRWMWLTIALSFAFYQKIGKRAPSSDMM